MKTDFVSQNLTAGQLNAIVKNLGGEEAALRFLRGELVVQEREFPFHVTGELMIQIPALARPTLEELRKDYSFIRSIERDTSPTDAVTLNLATILRSNEERVKGEEYERRIAQKLDLILGFQQAVWLVKNQDKFPDFMAPLGKIYIDFSGIVVVVGNGHRGVPCLARDGRRWGLYWYWFGRGFGRYGRLAISSK